MEKKITNEYLANKLSYSISTVHKALNNCPGIDAKTKSRIRTAAAEVGYSPTIPEERVAVILPAVPAYFWGRVRKDLQAAAARHGIRTKHHIYSGTRDGEDALQCIETAKEAGATVFLCALPDTQAIRDRLAELAPRVLVLLLEQLLPIPNAFYVGGDPYRDGLHLATEYGKKSPDASSFAILHVTDFFTERERIRGFSEGICATAGRRLYDIPKPAFAQARAAYYARALSALSPMPRVIFCPSGQMREARLAVCKLKREIAVIGFDDCDLPNDTTDPCLWQDTEKMAEEAMLLAKDCLEKDRFPEKKMWYVAPLAQKKESPLKPKEAPCTSVTGARRRAT